MDGLTTSQLAKICNVNIETIRYYEKRQLISKPPRTKSGYRLFSHETVEDIQFIKRAQEVGFTLSEIKYLLSVYKGETYFPVEEMYQFATTKVQKIDQQIHQLHTFKALLELVINGSYSGSPLAKNECPVINKLIQGGIKNG